MAVDKAKIYEVLGNSMETVCVGRENCSDCQSKDCYVGYAKEYIEKCKDAQVKGLADGNANIPAFDIKTSYIEEDVLKEIANLLVMCHDCEADHTEDCVINVCRNCLEGIEFGDLHEYPGNALMYLMKLSREYPEKVAELTDMYKALKSNK